MSRQSAARLASLPGCPWSRDCGEMPDIHRSTSMADRDQKPTHAEGQHGDKTHSAFIDSLHQGERTTDDVAERGSAFGEVSSDGKHRLSEDRQQHDEAEKNSESRKQGKPSDASR